MGFGKKIGKAIHKMGNKVSNPDDRANISSVVTRFYTVQPVCIMQRATACTVTVYRQDDGNLQQRIILPIYQPQGFVDSDSVLSRTQGQFLEIGRYPWFNGLEWQSNRCRKH